MSKMSLCICLKGFAAALTFSLGAGCAALQSTDAQIQRFPASYVSELCSANVMVRTETIKENCLHTLKATVGTPALIEKYEARLELEAREQSEANRAAQEEAIMGARATQAVRQKEKRAEDEQIAVISTSTGVPYGGLLSTSMWDAQGGGFERLKNRFYSADIPLRIVICNENYCLVEAPGSTLTFSMEREANDLVGSFIGPRFVLPLWPDKSGNLLMRRL